MVSSSEVYLKNSKPPDMVYISQNYRRNEIINHKKTYFSIGQFQKCTAVKNRVWKQRGNHVITLLSHIKCRKVTEKTQRFINQSSANCIIWIPIERIQIPHQFCNVHHCCVCFTNKQPVESRFPVFGIQTEIFTHEWIKIISECWNVNLSTLYTLISL